MRVEPVIPNYSGNIELQDEYRQRCLERLKDAILEKIRMIIRTEHIFKKGADEMADSASAYVEGNSIIIHSEKAHFKYHNEGTRPHVMWYLLGKTIPITKSDGTKTFRKATLGSFLKGKWQNPGIKPKRFVEFGVSLAMARLADIMKDVQDEMDYELSIRYGRAA